MENRHSSCSTGKEIIPRHRHSNRFSQQTSAYKTDCVYTASENENAKPTKLSNIPALTSSSALNVAAGSCWSVEGIDLIEASPNATCSRTLHSMKGLAYTNISKSDRGSTMSKSSETGIKHDTNMTPDAVENDVKNLEKLAAEFGTDLSPSDKYSEHMIDDDDLPATQPVSAFLLSSITAYVEVRTGGDNRSRGIMHQLTKLGATVVDKFTRDVTHVVFKEGKVSTYKKAIKWQVHLVSTLWIEECKVSLSRVPEKLYPPFNMDQYKYPQPFQKIKRFKSFQPDFGNDREKRIKRMRIKRKRLENQITPSKAMTDENVEFDYKPATSTKSRGPCDDMSHDNSLVRALYALAGKIDHKYDQHVKRPNSPNSSEEEREPTPLAVRLLRRIVSSQFHVNPNSSRTGNDFDNVAPMKKNVTISTGTESILELSPVSSIHETPSMNRVNKRFIDQIPHPGRTFIPETPTADTPTNELDVVLSTDLDITTPKSPILGIMHFNSVSSQRRISMRHQILNSAQKQKSKKLTDELLSEEGTDMKTSYQGPITPPHSSRPTSIEDHNRTTTSTTSNFGLVSTQKKRKLFNIVRSDESPKLCPINESSSEESNYPNCVDTLLPKVKSPQIRHSIDMELTDCVSNSDIILTNPMKKRRIDCDTDTAGKLISDSSTPTNKRAAPGRVSLFSGSRRSSIYFKKMKSPKTKTCNSLPDMKPLPTLVCTSLHNDQVEEIGSAVASLGGFEKEEKVTSRTTHIVCDKLVRRTINLLKGIARGCWIVKYDWVLKSLQAGKWLDEEKYEATKFSPSVQQCRLEKLSFGPAYKLKFFQGCGSIYVNSNTDPPCKDLVELITLCGGRIAHGARAAQIVVGAVYRNPSTKCVDVKWVLDSITAASLKATDDYLIQKRQPKP